MSRLKRGMCHEEDIQNILTKLEELERTENLATGIDANTIRSSGLYRIIGNGTETNFPMSANGFLIVSQFSEYYVIQKYVNYNGITYLRTCWRWGRLAGLEKNK